MQCQLLTFNAVTINEENAGLLNASTAFCYLAADGLHGNEHNFTSVGITTNYSKLVLVSIGIQILRQPTQTFPHFTDKFWHNSFV